MSKIRFICFFIFFITVWFYLNSASGQSRVTISASVDSSTITIGDLITYTVKITHDEDVEVQLPSLGENLGGFEIRDYVDFEPKKQNKKIIHQVDYIISTFETGEFEIPPISVGYRIPPDTIEHVLKTESIKIVVESVNPSEDGDIRDIKSPWEISYNWKPVILIGGILLFVILLIVVLIYVIRKRRRGETIMPRKLEPPRPPHEVAYEELQRLAESDYLEKGEIKVYYSEVSDIIRRYIEGRYQIIAMELTTTEVLDQLKSIDIEEDLFDQIITFLESCDLVKFAKYIPGAEENEEILKLAIHIVDVTKWIEQFIEEDIDEGVDSKDEESDITAQTQLDSETGEPLIESTLQPNDENLINDQKKELKE
jgi:hypothetical protein